MAKRRRIAGEYEKVCELTEMYHELKILHRTKITQKNTTHLVYDLCKHFRIPSTRVHMKFSNAYNGHAQEYDRKDGKEYVIHLPNKFKGPGEGLRFGVVAHEFAHVMLFHNKGHVDGDTHGLQFVKCLDRITWHIAYHHLLVKYMI